MLRTFCHFFLSERKYIIFITYKDMYIVHYLLLGHERIEDPGPCRPGAAPR